MAGYDGAPFADALLELAEEHPEVVVLSADLSKYTDVLPFAERYPDRFFQVGMAEQNMMGIAGGLAKTGLLPIAVTYGVFATRRSFEQVAMAFSTGPSRAIVVAFLPGITTPFRATHQATDDLALTRTVPGMTVADPADGVEMRALLRAAVAHHGPVYMRGLRGRVARILDPAPELRLGETRMLRSGSDVGVITTGLAAEWAAEALALDEVAGIDVGWLHAPTIKPLERDAVTGFCAAHRAVVTIENHSIVGGLGSAVAEVVASRGLPVPVWRLGVPDVWAPAGSVSHVREQLELDGASIARAIAVAAADRQELPA